MEIERPDWLPQMEAVLETLNEAVLIADDCNQIIFVNERFMELTGFTSEELLGRGSTHFFSGEDKELLQRHIDRGQQAGRNKFEFYLPRRDGGRVPVLISSRVMEDPDGRLFAIVAFADISELKKTEEDLREANGALEEQHRQIQIELTLAERVQQSLTPMNLVWGRVSVEVFYLPAHTIGGDFALVKAASQGHLNLLICDVSGHGISSALLANRIYSETMSLLDRDVAPGDMLHHLNRFTIHNLGASGFFFTMAAVRLSADGKKLAFAGGGHPPVMLIDSSGSVRRLESLGLILGTLDDAVSGDISIETNLNPGDRVVLYSDGLTDVFDVRGEMLGITGLQKIVQAAAQLPLAEMKGAILGDVERWRSGPISDDASLLIAEVH